MCYAAAGAAGRKTAWAGMQADAGVHRRRDRLGRGLGPHAGKGSEFVRGFRRARPFRKEALP